MRESDLLCCFAIRWINTVLLQHRFCSQIDAELWVTMLNDMVKMQWISRERNLLCCLSMRWINTVSLDIRYQSLEDAELWVPTLNNYGKNAVNEERTWLTVLFCNALARDCVPSSPSTCDPRFSILNVFYWMMMINMQLISGKHFLQCSLIIHLPDVSIFYC